MNFYIKSLLDNSPFGVISFNNSGKVTVFNKQMERFMEKSEKEMLGKHYSSFLPSVLINLIEKKFKENDREILTEEVNLVRNRKVYIYRVSIVPFYTENGDKLGVQVIFSDITLIKQLEEEVRRTEKLASLGIMAAGLAHELKNPLVSIKTFSQLLPVKFDDPEFRETFSQVIMEETDRINSLVEQVLQFSRPQIVEIKEIDVIDILRSTILMVKQTTKKGIEIIENYPDKEIKIVGDNDKVKQVFLNILINALDAVEDSGKIQVKVEEEDDIVKVSIKDNGCGIKEENLNKVFDPFFTTKNNGTGLGLSIVARIVDELKGRIRISSEEGKGTEVMLYFKMVDGGEK